MGLFGQKPRKLKYDKEECLRKKERMRQIFNQAVADGDSYRILRATKVSPQQGFFGGRSDAYHHYILGYRRVDGRMAMVLVDRALARHSEASFLEAEALAEASYDPQGQRACLRYRRGRPPELLGIGDTGSRTAYGIPDTVQEEEREDFLSFLDALRLRLEGGQGHRS